MSSRFPTSGTVTSLPPGPQEADQPFLPWALPSIDRAQFIEEPCKYNIAASVHFIPLHLHPYYRIRLNLKRGDHPVAEAAYDRIVSLPFTRA